MFFFKNKTDAPTETSHWFIGIHLSSNVRKLETALVGLNGNRPGAAMTLKKSASFDLPPEIFDAFDDLRRDLLDEQEERFARNRTANVAANGATAAVVDGATPSSSSVLTKLTFLRSMVATIQEEAIKELLAETDVEKDAIVAVATNDPGVWTRAADWDDRLTNCGLGDAAALAEKTGLNVVDAFAAKDWPSTGQGSSVFALPYWILLGDSDRDRLLVDLGATARWTYIPSSNVDKRSWRRVRFGEIGPCGSLLDALTERATKGESRIDVGGKLSVQGRRLPALLDFWRASVRENEGKDALPPRYFATPASKTFGETFFLEQIRCASEKKWSSLDALCAAVHWIAESTFAAVQDASPQFAEPFDVVLTGAAKQNGLLFNRLAALFAPRTFRSLAEIGFLEDSFDAAAVATLGVLFAAGVPASLPELTGAKRAALLGRVSPGTPENWKRFWQFRIA